MSKLSDVVLAGVDENNREEAWKTATYAWRQNTEALKNHVKKLLPDGYNCTVIFDPQYHALYVSASKPHTYSIKQGGLNVVLNESDKFFTVPWRDLGTKTGMENMDKLVPAILASLAK